MATRLGNVLWWAGVLISLGTLALCFALSDRPGDIFPAWVLVFYGPVPLLVGGALRYILGGGK